MWSPLKADWKMRAMSAASDKVAGWRVYAIVGGEEFESETSLI